MEQNRFPFLRYFAFRSLGQKWVQRLWEQFIKLFIKLDKYISDFFWGGNSLDLHYFQCLNLLVVNSWNSFQLSQLCHLGHLSIIIIIIILEVSMTLCSSPRFLIGSFSYFPVLFILPGCYSFIYLFEDFSIINY